MPPTHEVFNQPPALTGYDVADDPAMLSALRREGAAWARDGIGCSRPRNMTSACAPRHQAGTAGGHVDDREAGWFRRPGEHHPRCAGAGGWQLPPDRAQVVHLGADGRPVHGARAGAGRIVLLPAAAGAAGRHPERHAPAAPQGQARQPVQCIRRPWRSPFRVLCSSVTATPPWPTHSWRPGSPGTGVTPSARSPPAPTPPQSSGAPRPKFSRRDLAGET